MTRLATLVVVALMSAGVFAQGAARGGAQTPPAAPKQPPPLDKAFAPLQGTWIVNDINGSAMPSMLLVFKGDKYEQLVGENVAERGTARLDATKKPIAIDLVIQEGSDTGKVQLGIVEVTGDTMSGTVVFGSFGDGKWTGKKKQ